MEAEFIKKIVKKAEAISKRQFDVYQKDNNGDLVTNLDMEIEKYLIGQIKEKYPNYTIVSEEFNSDNSITDDCFIIDPIDGTINFANSIPLWGIQIACRKGDKTVASVIDLPELNELYLADEMGAYLNGRKISVCEVPVKNAIYAISQNNVLGIEGMRKYSRNQRNLGAACAIFAFLAAGRMHGVSFTVENPWDYEPGLFLCKMAGAKTKNIKGFHAAAMNQEFLDVLEKETAL